MKTPSDETIEPEMPHNWEIMEDGKPSPMDFINSIEISLSDLSRNAEMVEFLKGEKDLFAILKKIDSDLAALWPKLHDAMQAAEDE